MIDDRRGEGRFWAMVILAAGLVGWLLARSPVPSPLGATSPANEFSAARARETLTRVLGDETPHPTGSAEADLVRQRVVEEFRALGIEPTLEESLVCDERGSCAFVRNVLAEIPGREAGPAVLLNAHYDSVAAGPGAGDDGAGVAALLESARALKAGPPLERPVRFLVDDAEEVGLLGAEAWVRTHAPEETLAVVVLEARGSSGPALMFETNRGNKPLIEAYARAMRNPSTSSVFFSIYERLPNRTNFTVFKRAGYTGMAVAFIEDPAQYHTPLNDLSHLSDASLQHMGDLVLSVAREVGTRGLATPDTTASYFDLLGATVVLWPESWNVGFAVAALALVAIVGVIAMRRERATAVQVVVGWFLILLLLVLSGALGWLLWKAAGMKGGQSDWIASAGFLLTAAWLASFMFTTAPYIFVRRPPSLLSIWTSVWLIEGIVGVVLARLLPGAAYLFFIPAMAAGLSGLVTLAGRKPDRNEGMVAVPFIVSMLLVVPIVGGLYVGLGLVALPGIAVLATLVLLPLLAASTEARRQAMMGFACLVAVIACVAVFFFRPVYSADVPRGVNVGAIHQPDGTTTAVLLGAADPMPDSLVSGTDWSKQPVELFRRRGAAEAPLLWSAAIEATETPAMDLSQSTRSREGEPVTVRIVGIPAALESVIRFELPNGAKAESVSYGGQTTQLANVTSGRLALNGVPAEGFVLTAKVAAGSTITVIEERPALPAAARAIAKRRSEREVPIGPGDRALVVSSVSIDTLPLEPLEEIEARVAP